jgi:hypothetical protein
VISAPQPYFVCSEPKPGTPVTPHLTIRMNRAPGYSDTHLRVCIYGREDVQRLITEAVPLLDRDQRINLIRHIATTL